MEENKYYTPLLEEFHIGFECETLGDERSPEKNDSWDLIIINNIHDLKNFCIYYKDKCSTDYRVKLLDRSDIESLGWEFIPDNSTGDGNFRWFNEFKIGEWTFAYWGKIDDANWQKESLMGLIMKSTDRMFQGYIKNVSELKKIMLMLNIK